MPELDHVQIAAPRGCEPEARRFFGDLLGLAEIPKPEPLRGRGGVWFALGERELHVGVESPFAPARKAHPAIRYALAELRVLRGGLAAASVPITAAPALPGVERFYAEDPFGNRIELLARPE